LWDEKDRKGTKRDEEGTSLDFVPVPHSNLGPGSGKIPARNDPEQIAFLTFDGISEKRLDFDIY